MTEKNSHISQFTKIVTDAEEYQTGEANPNTSRKYFMSFSFIWASILFICNFLTICSAMFWIGAEGYPRGTNVAFEVLLEALLISDFFIRICLSRFKSNAFYFQKIYHKIDKENLLDIAFNLISVVPYVAIFSSTIDYDQSEADLASYFHIFKLFRIRNLKQYLNSVQILLIYTDFRKLFAFALMKTFLNLILFTHLATCLLIIVTKFQGDNTLGYFVRTGKKNSPLIYIYTDSALWAICSMEGNTLGDVTPRTTPEIFLTTIVMFLGASFYAQIFGDFQSIMNITRKEDKEQRKKFDNCKEFCIERKIPSWIRKKIKEFYTMELSSYFEVQYFSKLSEIPISLHTEVSLFYNEEMIKNVKLFNLSTPAFIIAISKHLRPKIAMAGDIVLRFGEIAEEFFFIRKGKVEIIATDNHTVIATLEEGCYFGEIGLLISGKRTVTVKAATDCFFQVLVKDKFEMIMNLFPDQKKFLTRVANQRIKTTSVEDLNEQHNSISVEYRKRDSFRSSLKGDLSSKKTLTQQASRRTVLSPTIEATNPQKLFIPILTSRSEISFGDDNSNPPQQDSLNISKAFNEGITTSTDNFDFKTFVIFPSSRIFRVWFFVIMATCLYNLLYVPFSISFASELTTYFIVIDIILFIIYSLDFFVQSRTSFKLKEDYIQSPDILLFNYMNQDFMIDLFSFLPLDYLIYLSGEPGSIMRWIRILRFLKLIKLNRMINIIEEVSERNMSYLTLIKTAVIFIYMNHFFTCIMYSIAFWAYFNLDGKTMIKSFDQVILEGQTPLLEVSIYIRYLNFLYFSFGVASGGSYGDIFTYSPIEKSFHIFALLLFRINFSFLAAEVTNIASSSKSSFSDHLIKLHNLNQWMDHIKLPQKIKSRVVRYHEHLWNKFKGINDHTILNDLPESIRNEVLLFLFRDVVEKIRYFPKNDNGIILTLVKRLRILMFTKGEWVCRSGELAREMYFIIDGQAAVYNETEDKMLAILTKSEYFGEMAILSGKASIRSASVKAVTNLSLASFSLDNFNLICNQYPVIYENIQHLAQERKRMNEERKNVNGGNEEHALLKLHKEKVDDSEDFSPKEKRDGEKIIEEVWSKSKKRKDSFLLSTPKANQIRTHTFGTSHSQSNEENPSKPLFPRKNIQLTVDIPILNASGILSSPLKKNSEGRSPLSSTKHAERKFFGNGELRISTPLRLPVVNECPSLQDFPEATDNQTDLSKHFSGITIVQAEHSPTSEENSSRSIVDLMKSSQKNPNSATFQKKEASIHEIFAKSGESVIKGTILENVFREEDFLINPNDIGMLEPSWLHNSIDSQIFKSMGKTKSKMFSYWVYQKIFLRLKYVLKKIGLSLKTKRFWLFLMVFYNIIYVPLHLAFNDFGFSVGFIIAEMLCFLVFFIDLTTHINSKVRRNNEKEESISESLQRRILNVFKEDSFIIIYKIILVIPFIFIFEAIDMEGRRCEIPLLLLQCFRMSDLKDLFLIFSYFKRRNIAVTNIVQIIFSYILFAHVIACFFILIAYCEGNNSNCWFRNIPSPRGPTLTENINTMSMQSIYIHALYWTYSTTCHVGFSDVVAINLTEKAYSSFTMMISTFMTVFFFGNIASLADELTPVLKALLNDQYKTVMIFLKDSNLRGFHEKVEKYFDYSWRSNKGIDENHILDDLPHSVKCDIQMHRYLDAIQNGRFFRVQSLSSFNVKITYSILKFLKYETYMPDDLMIVAGEIVDDVFILLEGQAEVLGFDLRLSNFFNPGDHFGGIEPGEKQPYYIKANKICKVGVLQKKDFEMLCDAYPRWIKKLREENRALKMQMLADLSFFKNDNRDLLVEDELIKYYESDFKQLEQHLGHLESLEPLLAGLNTNKQNIQEISPSNAQKQMNGVHNINGERRRRKSWLENQGIILFRTRESTLFNKKIVLEFKDLIRLPIWKSDYIIVPNSNIRYMADVLHLIFMLYNIFAITFYVSFQIELTPEVLALEIIYICEGIFHIFLELKTAQYIEGLLNSTFQVLFLRYLKRELIFDLFCVIPINLALMGEKSIISSLIRLARLIQLIFLKDMVFKVEGVSRSFVRFFTFFKGILLLGIVWHFSACLCMWVNLYVEAGDEFSFYVVKKLATRSTAFQYLFSLFFVMNIVTTAGSDEVLPQNDLEKCIFFVIVYIGNAIFAMSFGLIASNVEIFPEKYNELFDGISQINKILDKKNIPYNLKFRIEQYFTYVIDLRAKDHTNFLMTIRKILPKKMFEDMLFMQAKPFLLKLPILSEMNNTILLKEIAKILDSAIFLPNDYIIYKDDLGEEMYFIRDGLVNVLSPNENQIICTLSKGSYFGEIALFIANSRRICSVVAASNFVQVFILKKNDLKMILEKFPTFEEVFKKEGQRRLEEYKAKEEALKKVNEEKKSESSCSSISEEEEEEEEAVAENKSSEVEKKEENENEEKEQKEADEEKESEDSPVNIQKVSFSKMMKISRGNSLPINVVPKRNNYVDSVPEAPKKEKEAKTSIKQPPPLKTLKQIKEEEEKLDFSGLAEMRRKSAFSKAEQESPVLDRALGLKKVKKRVKKKLKTFSETSIEIAKRIESKEELNDPKKLVRKGTLSSKYNVEKIKTITGEHESKIQVEEEAVFSFNEFVEEDELDNPRIKKQSKRKKVRNNRERRYSRITLGKELILSKTSGLRLQWAINKS